MKTGTETFFATKKGRHEVQGLGLKVEGLEPKRGEVEFNVLSIMRSFLRQDDKIAGNWD
jgi:hypothetical protein